jgi:hypothetical protein
MADFIAAGSGLRLQRKNLSSSIVCSACLAETSGIPLENCSSDPRLSLLILFKKPRVFANPSNLTPRLRHENRIRTIQASLAIENNTLNLEQVTAGIERKHVLGHPREIQEVRNAFAAYEAMEGWDARPFRRECIGGSRVAHARTCGRNGSISILRRRDLPGRPAGAHGPSCRTGAQADGGSIGLACNDPGAFVGGQLRFTTSSNSSSAPLPAATGEGGACGKTLTLRNWKPLLAYLPVETVIHERQEDYYRMLAVLCMLGALRDAIREAVATDQLATLLRTIGTGELSSKDLMQALGLSHRPTFRKNHLNPALEDEWIERTQPDSPRSPTQRYRLTDKASVAATPCFRVEESRVVTARKVSRRSAPS